MAYQAFYQEVYLPLVIEGCSVAELCCDVTLEQDGDDFFCRSIRIHSDTIEGKESTVLEFGDKDVQQIFDALESSVKKQLSEQYFEDLKEVA